MSRNLKFLLTILGAVIALGILIYGYFIFTANRENELPSIDIVNTNNSDNKVSTVDYTYSSIETKEGVVIAELISTSEQKNSAAPLYHSRIYLKKKDGAEKVLRTLDTQNGYLRIFAERSDEDRILFYTQPDGLGGYIISRISPDLHVIDINDDYRTEKVSNEDEYENADYYDITHDMRYVVFTIGNSTTPAIFDRINNSVLQLKKIMDEEYQYVSDMVFLNNDTVLKIVLARNNPENESFKTIEYSMNDGTFKTVVME